MLIVAGFWLFLLCALMIVWKCGDAEARAFGGAVVAASILTALAMWLIKGPRHAEIVFGIDTTLLVFALVLVGQSRSFWPLWFAGFHSVTVASELARQIFPKGFAALYGNAAAFWALPALASMTIGIMLDHRQVSKISLDRTRLTPLPADKSPRPSP